MGTHGGKVEAGRWSSEGARSGLQSEEACGAAVLYRVGIGSSATEPN